MYTASEMPDILYEDAHILVVFKRAGLPVQSAGIGKTDLQSLLMKHLAEEKEGAGRDSGKNRKKSQAGRHSGNVPYLGIVHRLDQPVQGLLVFAKTPEAAAALSAQTQDGRMKKTYLALTEPAEKGRKLLERIRTEGEVLLRNDLIRDGRTNTSRVASAAEQGRKEAKEARLILSPAAGDAQDALISGKEGEEPAEGPVLLQIRLLTGRHHQIRVQLSHAGLPIAGDRKYGHEYGHGGTLPRTRIQGADDLRQAGPAFPALCAYDLAFTHPETGKELHFQVLPDFARRDVCCAASEESSHTRSTAIRRKLCGNTDLSVLP